MTLQELEQTQRECDKQAEKEMRNGTSPISKRDELIIEENGKIYRLVSYEDCPGNCEKCETELSRARLNHWAKLSRYRRVIELIKLKL